MKSQNTVKTLLSLVLILAFSFAEAQDIIVLNNGELIKSKVLEIDLSKIKYKRFDQQEGPTYSVLKELVFAIHYEDGTKDIYGNIENRMAKINTDLLFLVDTPKTEEPLFMDKRKVIHVGIGLHKLYSPVNEIGVENYKASSIYYTGDIGVGIFPNIVVGFNYGRGNYSANQSFSDEYEFTTTTFDISQEISSFSVFGRYYLQVSQSNFRPYAALGMSLNSSDVETLITTSTNGQNIEFSRGGKIMDLFPIMRLGMELDISNGVGAYTEVGYGVMLINVGVQYSF